MLRQNLLKQKNNEKQSGAEKLGGASEREYREKISKTRENLSKGIKDVREKFAKMQKMKAEALKKIEETKRDADKELDKMEIDIPKSQDLASESKERLRTEIFTLRRELQEKYTELKKQISETLIPS
jgi:hypothetical protein